MPRDREGNYLTWDEWKARFKEGVEAITPMQQTKVSLMGSILVIIGVIIGIIVTISTKVWWLLIILCGSLFITGMSLVGIVQKYIALARINKAMEELNEQTGTDGI